MERVLKKIERLSEFVLNVIFPPSEEGKIVLHTTIDSVVSLIDVRETSGVTALTQFSNETVVALIHEAKYHGNKRAFTILGTILQHYLLSRHPEKGTLLIPIPLSRARMRTRGYNQVAEIVRYATHGIEGLVVKNDILERKRDTLSQTDLSRSERLTNVADAFGVRDPNIIANAHIILTDDVLTTGATMQAAKKAILAHRPATLVCIALAH